VPQHRPRDPLTSTPAAALLHGSSSRATGRPWRRRPSRPWWLRNRSDDPPARSPQFRENSSLAVYSRGDRVSRRWNAAEGTL